MSFALDANLLVYASDEASPLHGRAREFLRGCAEGSSLCCLAWSTVMAYLRIATHPSVFTRPLTPREAMDNVDALLARPQVRLIEEQDGFWSLYQDIAGTVQPRGNLVPDTHLATLLLQHGVTTLYTRDRDFRRFDFLSVIDPLEDAVREQRPRRRARR